MISIYIHNDQLLLKYKADRGESDWVDEYLTDDGTVTLGRTFTFGSNALIDDASPTSFGDERVFELGSIDGDYFRIKRNILDLKYDLLLTKRMSITNRTFIAYKGISIFNKIDRLIDEPIVIGGELAGSIPVADFEVLVKTFPTHTELTHYADSRITRVLKDYFGTMSDSQKKLETFLKRKSAVKSSIRVETLGDYELEKFEYIRTELHTMLADAETYPEKDWQKLILGFLLLIFPKYVAVLDNLHIKDFYSNPTKPKDRYIDLTLVDANGTIDIIEIKKPFTNCLLSANKYRDNYTPKTELSGAVMQVEKYVFHLNKWGRDGEVEILKKRKEELPPNFEIKITNPKAMIILGRDNDFANDQKFDFEIIKRKYANIIDIMTYDDLLRRLDNMIAMITFRSAKHTGLPTGDASAVTSEE